MLAKILLTLQRKHGNPSGGGARIGNLIIHVQIAITCKSQCTKFIVFETQVATPSHGKIRSINPLIPCAGDNNTVMP